MTRGRTRRSDQIQLRQRLDLLQAKIDARMATLDAALTAKWIPIPDTPGVAGSTGYIAGQAVLDRLIAAVKAYAAKKGWT